MLMLASSILATCRCRLLPFSCWLSAYLNHKRVGRGKHSRAPAITPIFISRIYHSARFDATSSRLDILTLENPRVVKRREREVSTAKPLKPCGQLRPFRECKSECTGMFPAPDKNEGAYKIAAVMSDQAWRVGVARLGDGHVPCKRNLHLQERHCLRRGDRCLLDQSRVRMGRKFLSYSDRRRRITLTRAVELRRPARRANTLIRCE